MRVAILPHFHNSQHHFDRRPPIRRN